MGHDDPHVVAELRHRTRLEVQPLPRGGFGHQSQGLAQPDSEARE